MLLRTLHLFQATLAIYGSQQYLQTLNNLLVYKKITKYAKYSMVLDHKIKKKKEVKISGGAAILLSLTVALTLALWGSLLSVQVQYLISPAMVGAVETSRRILKKNWAKGDSETVGPRILLPQMQKYNEAQKGMEEIFDVGGGGY
ncbi:uncharacterized protein BCR38DRAFT_491783 [Pseudomassariella vexata]|uniref:Uncharacterized protein n=1 Tax=Pseudomassariella vexata TaxID=1141098 RepID=A0A1Y2EHE0_9PEZI|nr:uncharacterized protein BCR38DRAFT_491783 [Pseudomassariella vexata]ORY70978.1 hypothetical protein BCR38DRAFT_491783 [Pseudomassariella vexata]